MWLFRTVSACVLLTATLAYELSDLGLTTGDESTGLSVEHTANVVKAHPTHHKLKHKCKKKKPHGKAPPIKGLNGDALGPMPSRAGAVRDNYEVLSKMSSLNPNFWVRKNLRTNITAQPKWKQKSDCFYGSRDKMRPYPKYPTGIPCYTMDFAPRMRSWWNFWAEIRGDLQYAFDFVMWDEYEQYHETNSFWYLMLYLKTLVKRVSNPNDIMTLSAKRPHSRPWQPRTTIHPPWQNDSRPSFPPSGHQKDLHLPFQHKDEQNVDGEPPAEIDDVRDEPHDTDFKEIFDLLKEYQEKLDHLETLMVGLL